MLSQGWQQIIYSSIGIKTEDLVIGPEAWGEKLLLWVFKPSQSVEYLGVILDSELSFITHIKTKAKICFYQIYS